MKKFYIVHDNLIINGEEAADYFEYRFTSTKPEEISLTTNDWHELTQLAVREEYTKMNLQMVPPSVIRTYYVRSLALNKRYYKHTFKELTHTRTVTVPNQNLYSLPEAEVLLQTMPMNEFLQFQHYLVLVLWEMVINRKCDPYLIDSARLTVFEDFKQLSPEEFKKFMKNLRTTLQKEKISN